MAKMFMNAEGAGTALATIQSNVEDIEKLLSDFDISESVGSTDVWCGEGRDEFVTCVNALLTECQGVAKRISKRSNQLNKIINKISEIDSTCGEAITKAQETIRNESETALQSNFD